MGRDYKPHGGGRGNRRVLPDMGAGLSEAIARLEALTGFKVNKQELIADGVTFRTWCEQLGRDGLKIDGKPFRLDNRPAMAWIYEQIPSTHDEAYLYVLVLMKCAQVGFTVMEMLATIYLGLKFGPAIIGMFLPDMNLAAVKSTERFMPLVRSVPRVHALMTQDDSDGKGRKSGEGNVHRRRIGEALFVFSWTSGRATTESIPMDVLSFDEVQEMTIAQMEKAGERVSASAVRFTLMGSTANWPEADIHHWYLLGTQHRFHSKCPTCGASKPLDEYFPQCIKHNPEIGAWRYVCENGHYLEDPQHGEWVALRPERDQGPQPGVAKNDRRVRIKSIHFPQFLSPDMGAGQILDAYNTAEDMKNFYNRKLGKPFLDPSLVPVTLEHLKECERLGAMIGLQWKTRARYTYMGIDQMGRYNVHVIKERLPDGRQAVIHVEETYSEDPFLRSSELMEAYGVQCCVVEVNPNYNDAKRFAGRHLGKVFICDSFGSMIEGMITWGDAPKLDVSERRTDEGERDRYTLRMDQYKCMQVSMMRFVKGLCLFPPSKELVQEVNEKGQKQILPVLPRAWHHFTKTALVAEKDEETNKFRRSVKKIGIDPHFSYANMLCDVAWARAFGTSTFLLPEAPEVDPNIKLAERMDVPGLPKHVIALVRDLPAGEVCGKCTSFPVEGGERGLCAERAFTVEAKDPGCPMFVGVS